MDDLVELLGESPAIRMVRDRLRRLLDRNRPGQRLPPVLIQGETGTGKGLVARLLHRHGGRGDRAFVHVNCAAIPETLLEAELFGFERGAFTDARRDKSGLFQTAHRGVLFLDEVASLSLPAQAKLLTAIEERSVRRLGSTRQEPADVWPVSATNADLTALVATRCFRADLYHRLSVLTLEMPPLRDRSRDVLLLADRFLARTCREYDLPDKRLDHEAQARLLAYAWPGNVRELANVIERAALFGDSSTVTADSLGPLDIERYRAVVQDPSFRTATSRDETIRQHLLTTLEQTAWNISRAATRLGVARNTVYARMEKFGLRADPPRKSVRGASSPVTSTVTSAGRDIDLRWEQRSIALLRADIHCTNSLDAWSQSSRALETVISKVAAFGGRVEEMSPSNLVVVFGHDTGEDAPRRAAHAALALRKEAERAHGPLEGVAPMTIGLHAATLLIGHVGARVEIDAVAKRAEWSVLDRTLGQAAPGETLASAAMAPFLERRFDLEPFSSPADDPPRVYRLTGQERRGLAIWGAMTRFVGRREEIEILRDRLTLAAGGHGQVATIVGEAGVGKSRLIYEFAHSPLLDRWLVLEAGTAPYGTTVATLLPVAGLLRNYFKIGGRDTHREISERVTGKLLTLDHALEPSVSPLLALLDVPVTDARWKNLDPSQRRHQTLEAVKHLLVRESRVQPVLLIFEDLATIDGETQALLDALVESASTSPFLLLGSYRPEYRPPWGNSSSYTQLHLDPLPADSAYELLDTLLGPDTSLASLKRLLAETTGRNPLFMEESVRTLVETHVLVGERGAFRLERDMDTIHVPDTVRAILSARIDRLPAGDRRLLEIAAVVGKDLPLALLELVSGMALGPLRAGLDRLQAAEFLFEARPAPDAEYTFKHALTHDASYDSVLPDRRRTLHARVASAIEQVYASRLPEHVERLAHHTLRGEIWEAALGYLREAGNKAIEHSAPREAAAWFELALGVLPHLPDNRATLEQAFDIQFELRHAVGNQGDLVRALACLRAAEGLAERLGDEHRRGRVYSFMVNNHNLRGELAEAVEVGARALEIGRRLADLEITLLTTTYLEQTYWFMGDFQRVVDLAQVNLRELPASFAHRRLGAAMPTALFDRGWLTLSLVQLGRFEEASEVAQTCIGLARELDHPYGLGWAYWTAGNSHMWRGAWHTAQLLYERSIDALREGQWRLQLSSTLAASSWVLARLGESAQAAARAEEAEQLYRSGRAKERKGGWETFVRVLCHTHLLLGQLEHALRLVEAPSPHTTPAAEAFAEFVRGEVASHPACFRREPAGIAYGRAVALAEACGMRPLSALSHLGLGRLRRDTQEGLETVSHLSIAARMFQEMDMEFWLEQAQAEIRGTRS